MLFQGDSYNWILLWHPHVSTGSLSFPTGIIPAKTKEKKPPYLNWKLKPCNNASLSPG